MTSTTRDLTGEILLMAPNPEAISAIASKLLAATKADALPEKTDSERRTLESDYDSYMRQFHRIILNWMGTGNTQAIADCLTALADVVKKNADHPRFLERVPLNDQFSASLQNIAGLLDCYLDAPNLSRMLGQLAGIQRDSWRALLVAMLKKPDITIADAVNGNYFRNQPAASTVFAHLCDMGLIYTENGQQPRSFRLSPAGREVARTLERLHPDDEIADSG